MEEILVSFRLGPGLSAGLIAWWGQGYGGFSHCDAILSDGRYLGARSDNPGGYGKGVVARPAGYEIPKREEIVALPVPPGHTKIWENWLLEQQQDKYDDADIISLIRGSKAEIRPGYWICSAVQLRAQRIIHMMPSEGIIDQQCPPNMLRAMMFAAGGYTKSENPSRRLK